VTMAMSLDGFITGPHDDAQNPAGIDGMRLMDWLSAGDSDAGGDGGGGGQKWRPRDPNSQIVFDEMLATGAVITGKRTGDFAGYWNGDHHEGVPIFVPTHRPPDDNPFERVHYVVDGIAECVRQAKEAAGARDVMLHGAYTAQEALKAGVLDAIEIQLRPVLLGQGRRLFDHLSPDHIELDLVRTLEAPGTLHLRYDVGPVA
jgi:dihydrofolate reductase